MAIREVLKIEEQAGTKRWRLWDYRVQGDTRGSEYVVRVAQLRATEPKTLDVGLVNLTLQIGVKAPQIVMWCSCPGFTNRHECSHQQALDRMFEEEDT
jgi:hypothetical protein